jgi:hypothetical protein
LRHGVAQDGHANCGGDPRRDLAETGANERELRSDIAATESVSVAIGISEFDVARGPTILIGEKPLRRKTQNDRSDESTLMNRAVRQFLDNAVGALWYDLLQLSGACAKIESKLGLNTEVAQVDDRPGADFLFNDLNAAANVSAELAHTATAVGVRVTAQNYTDGGPIRLFSDASTAYDWHVLINAAGAAFLGMEAYILNNDYPLTAQNYREMADADLDATLLFDFEDVWCAGVTEPHLTRPWLLRCEDNDGFISVTYQARPGAVGVDWLGANAHTSETQEDVRIRQMLSFNFGVR